MTRLEELIERTGVRVPLTQGYFATIDSPDAERVFQHKWQADKIKSKVYAVTTIKQPCGKWKKTSLHRFLLGLGPGEIGDHINGDGLDNRRVNLRSTTYTGNARNSRPYTKHGFKGVSKRRDVKSRPYYVHISINGKNTNFGWFKTAEEAARKYDELAKEHYGEHAWLNFKI